MSTQESRPLDPVPLRAAAGPRPAPTSAARTGARFGPFRLLESVATDRPVEQCHALWSNAPSTAERLCLLRRLPQELTGSPVFAQMFAREARLSGLLRHPNIVRAYATGAIEGIPYLALEYLDGSTLAHVAAQRQQKQQRMPVEVAIFVAHEVAAALAHAYDTTDETGRALRLAHGNLRPDNVAILRTGRVKLIDFGASRVVSFVRPGGPLASLRGAEPLYLAPERLAGAPVDARGDLFSLGVLLWELLCSQPLFPTVDGLVEAPIARPSRLRPEIPPDLDELVLGLLQRDASRRHQSADEARRTLAALLPSPTAAEGNLAVISCGGREVKSSGTFLAAVPTPRPLKAAARARPITRVVPALGAMFQHKGQPRAAALPGAPDQKSVRPVSELPPSIREGRASGRKSHGAAQAAPALQNFRLSAGRSRMAAIRDRRRGLAFRLVQVALISLLPLTSAVVGHELKVAEVPAPQRAPRSVLIQSLTVAPGTLDPSRFAREASRPRAGRRALQRRDRLRASGGREPRLPAMCRPVDGQDASSGRQPAQAGGVEQEIVAFGDAGGGFRGPPKEHAGTLDVAGSLEQVRADGVEAVVPRQARVRGERVEARRPAAGPWTIAVGDGAG